MAINIRGIGVFLAILAFTRASKSITLTYSLVELKMYHTD